VDAARAREVAAALGVEAFTDHRALAARVDCASVAVPTQHHFEVARDLLAAGIDVLVEKPVTTTVEEAKALVELAARGQRVFQVGHLERFNPAMLALEGLVTQPRFIECHRLAPFTERGTDVDVVLDLMIHDLDVILSIVPSALRSVEAVGVPVLTNCVDIANARLRFANGCIANVTASRVSMKRERKIRIFQADAYPAVDYGERRVRICRREPDADGQAALTLEEREVPEGDALEAEVDAFLRALRAREAGMETIADVGQVATMGLEATGRLRALWHAYRTLARRLRADPPDLCVLIDFPEFNLRLARVAKRAGVPVLYYIGPQVWAWRR